MRWQSAVRSKWLDTSRTSSRRRAQRSPPVRSSLCEGAGGGMGTRSASPRKVSVPSASFTTIGRSGRSNSDAEILRVGVEGTGLGEGVSVKPGALRGFVSGTVFELPVSVLDTSRDGWIECTRSVNQALTMSLKISKNNS